MTRPCPRATHQEHPFAKPVLIEDFSVSGVGAERHCTIDTNLVNYAGSLLPGRHYDREVTVVNHSDAAAPFRWVGHDPDAGLLVYPHEGILEPNGGSRDVRRGAHAAVGCSALTRR